MTINTLIIIAHLFSIGLIIITDSFSVTLSKLVNSMLAIISEGISIHQSHFDLNKSNLRTVVYFVHFLAIMVN